MAAHENINGEQLKMFMTANEILGRYQPLDADRQDYSAEGGEWRTRTDQWTHEGSTGYGYTSGGREYQRSAHPPEPVRGVFPTNKAWEHRGPVKVFDTGVDMEETSDELWDRKRDEAWDSGLRESIMEHGVKKPISLGTEIGTEGKPQLVGGHHRLAVMAEESPDELLPVLHYKNLFQARDQSSQAEKGRGGFRYT